MRIVIPYMPGPSGEAKVGLQGPTLRLGLELGAEFIDTSADDLAYWRILDQYWGTDFLLIENDMLPSRAQVNQIERCGELFCAFAYEMSGWWGPALGFTRFAAELGRLCPDFPRQIGPRHFGELDDRVYRGLKDRGVLVHLHEGYVRHLNPHQRSGLEPQPVRIPPAWA